MLVFVSNCMLTGDVTTLGDLFVIDCIKRCWLDVDCRIGVSRRRAIGKGMSPATVSSDWA